MPIEVTCPQCQTGMRLPDKAAGRAVKCKSCGGRVRVPGGERRPRQRRPAPEQQEEPVVPATDPDDFMGSLDLSRAADQNRRVCPGCAKSVGKEDVECPFCGVTIATGILSERERLRHKRKGPPPEEFYGMVWSDGWLFLKKNWKLAIRSGFTWGLFGAICFICSYTLQWYVDRQATYYEEEIQTEGVSLDANGFIVITADPDNAVKFDGYRFTGNARYLPPRILPFATPPALFWMGMFTVFQLGFWGWAWFAVTKVVQTTLAGKKKVKRLQSDFFGNLTGGFRFYFWPLVLMWPLMFIPMVGLLFGPVGFAVLWFVFIFAPPIFLFLPSAITHMAQKTTYRAWLIYWMVRDFFKTALPSLYTSGMLFFLVIIWPFIFGIIVALIPGLQNILPNVKNWWLAFFGEYVWEPESGGFLEYTLVELPFVLMLAYIFFTIFYLVLAFPAVFMMRVYGQFSRHFKADLSIVKEIVPLAPAGFGPRYLAFTIDYFICFLIALAFAVLDYLRFMLSGYSI